MSEGSDILAKNLAEAREEVQNWRIRWEQERQKHAGETSSLSIEIDRLKTEIQRYEAKVEAAEARKRDAEKLLRDRIQDLIRDGGLLLSRDQRERVLRFIPASETYAEVRALLGGPPRPPEKPWNPAKEPPPPPPPFRGSFVLCATEDGVQHVVKGWRVSVAGLLTVDTFCFRHLSPREIAMARTTCRECADRLKEESS